MLHLIGNTRFYDGSRDYATMKGRITSKKGSLKKSLLTVIYRLLFGFVFLFEYITVLINNFQLNIYSTRVQISLIFRPTFRIKKCSKATEVIIIVNYRYSNSRENHTNREDIVN